LLTNVPVVGISAGQNMEGLDFRPATGQLYAIGYNQTNGEAQIYTLQLTTGVATAVSTTPILLKPNLHNGVSKMDTYLKTPHLMSFPMPYNGRAGSKR
jgi:hypothetical protein